MQMTYRSTKAARRELSALAQGQGGYFTAKQAAEIGYDYPHLDYHVQAGNFERAGHGLYRLPEIPQSEHDDLVRLAFWSRNRSDQPQAVVSHATALALHGLSDLLPNRVHITVPPGFRKPAPKGAVIRRARLAPSDIQEREGFLVTTPLRSIHDAASDPSISEEHLERAVVDAIQRRLVRRSKLVALAKTQSEKRLSRALDAAR